MKYQANGGYQILNFEGADIENVSSLDYDVLSYAIKRQKVLMVVGLLIGTTLVNCIANASLDETNDEIILEVGIKKLVVSDDNNVEVKDTTENKKLYCHPISLRYSDASYNINLSLMVFNNSNEPINTPTKFKQWIDDLYTLVGNTIRVNCSGNWYDGNTAIMGAWLYVGSGQYGILGGSVDGTNKEEVSNPSFSTIIPDGTIVNDGVNEIYPNL